MADIITALTESQWFTSLMRFLGAEGVPIATWVGKRHPGLAWTKYLGRALASFDNFAQQIERSLFVQTATGLGLVKLSRSQFQLEPFPAQTQTARFLLRSEQGAPEHTPAAGDVVVGQLGGALEWVNAEAFTLESGLQSLVLFQAREAGAKYNIPNNSSLQLLTTLLGVSVSCPPSGAATTIGTGTAALLFYAAQAGVTVEIIDPALPSQSLSVAGNIVTKVLTVTLATDAGSVTTTTAQQLRDELVAVIANGGFAVDQVLLDCKLGGAGTGLVLATASPVALDWTGSYIQAAGAEEESAESLQRRDLTRFMGLGGWAGDGAPPAPVSTDEAMEFWARQPRPGASTSPVTGVRVLSNFLAGSPSGKDITVIVWGASGALTGAQLAAVEANYYNGRKFSTGCDLHVITVTNTAQALVGDVFVPLSAGYTEDEVRAAIAARFALYQQRLYPGMTLYPNILEARIADALPDGAIENVALTTPPAPVVFTYLQYPVPDLTGLNIVFT